MNVTSMDDNAFFGFTTSNDRVNSSREMGILVDHSSFDSDTNPIRHSDHSLERIKKEYRSMGKKIEKDTKVISIMSSCTRNGKGATSAKFVASDASSCDIGCDDGATTSGTNVQRARKSRRKMRWRVADNKKLHEESDTTARINNVERLLEEMTNRQKYTTIDNSFESAEGHTRDIVTKDADKQMQSGGRNTLPRGAESTPCTVRHRKSVSPSGTDSTTDLSFESRDNINKLLMMKSWENL